MKYIFSGTTFKQKECEILDKLFRKTVINKMGYSSATSLCIIHSSYLYSGLRIPTSWDLQGSAHLYLIASHLQINDLVNKQLKHCIDYLSLHLGLRDKKFTYGDHKIKDTFV